MQQWLLWPLIAFAILGLLFRPWRLPEALWTTLAAILLPVLGLLSWGNVSQAIRAGNEVYLFLFGMMVLSEVARREKLFDWLADLALYHARGSGKRLFVIIFVVAVFTTAFLSNDATIILLTPPVIVVARKAGVTPFPALLACAFVANAASYLLPISNPANLVLYGGAPPSLIPWLERFLLPSLAAVLVTFFVLFLSVRKEVASQCADPGDVPVLDQRTRLTAAALLTVAVLLTFVSFMHWPLGPATALCGGVLGIFVCFMRREVPLVFLKGISWSVFPLVASLFVLVTAVEQTSLSHDVARLLAPLGVGKEALLTTGFGIGLLSNLINNLPAGLLAAQLSPVIAPHGGMLQDALLIGVDLGPNLTLSGSLATVLWLIILRNHGLSISYGRFMGFGILVTLPALLCSLFALFLQQRM